MIPDEVVRRIRENVDIVEVAEEYLPLKKSGRNFTGLCPFHSEKTPSFNVSPHLGRYKCFGCGASGSVFDLVMHMERVDFPEAVRSLARRAGVRIDEQGPVDKARDSNTRLVDANRLALDFYHEVLVQRGAGQRAREYLEGRGFGREAMVAFRLGFAPEKPDVFLGYAARRGFEPAVLEAAGLVMGFEQEGRAAPRWRDRFRNRVMFPIFDARGRPVGFGGRTLVEELEGRRIPKYLNTRETPVFSKGKLLYGLERARETIRKTGRAIVVEGYTDVIALQLAGFGEALAVLGTGFTPEHALVLARMGAGRVVLVFDGDEAGQNAAMRTGSLLALESLDVEVAFLPEDMDPCDLLRSRGPEAFQAALDRGTSLPAFLAAAAIGKAGTGIAARTRAADELLELVARVENPVRKEQLLGFLSGELGVDEKTLRARLSKLVDIRRPRLRERRGPEGPGEAAKKSDPLVGSTLSERQLVQALLLRPELLDLVRPVAEAGALSSAVLSEVVRTMAAMAAEEGCFQPEALVERIPDAARDAVTTLMLDVPEGWDAKAYLNGYRESFEQQRQEQEKRNALKATLERAGAGGE